jgi:hypothetical protein
MGGVVPFPLTRRRDFLIRHVARMATLPPASAEKHLAHQLRVQAETMQRRGIRTALITAEVRALEIALRCEFCRVTSLKGGAA